jgi:hypothetical protein
MISPTVITVAARMSGEVLHRALTGSFFEENSMFEETIREDFDGFVHDTVESFGAVRHIDAALSSYMSRTPAIQMLGKDATIRAAMRCQAAGSRTCPSPTYNAVTRRCASA